MIIFVGGKTEKEANPWPVVTKGIKANGETGTPEKKRRENDKKEKEMENDGMKKLKKGENEGGALDPGAGNR